MPEQISSHKTLLSDRQWKRLIRDIKEQRCVLMLGPKIQGLKTTDVWEPLIEVFSESLCGEIEDSGMEFEKEASRNLSYIAQRFLNIPDALRIDLEDDARDFYKANTKVIPPIYEKLSQFPFHLVINTTMDDYMERAFIREGKNCKSNHYNFKRKVKDPIYPELINAKSPLVYNLLGTYHHSESMVLSEQNQLEFVRNVVQGNPGIPEEILEQFDGSKSYLFIGFDLEHWQFRLLLESLNIKEGNTTLAPKSSNYSLRNITKSFFKDHFQFHFVDQYVEELVDELIEKLAIEKEKDLSKSVASVSMKNVFIVYNEKDDEICNRLEITLRPLESKNQIRINHRGRISPGEQISIYVNEKINEAHVILLLLSADFLADDDLQKIEFEMALEKYKNKTAKVIPVIGRACDWNSISILNDMIPLMDGLPLTGNNLNNEDEAYLQIVEELKKRAF